MGRKSLNRERFAISIDKHAAGDIGTPGRIVAVQERRRARIFTRNDRVPHGVGDVAGVAQSHVQALRADRRQHMSGFADQRDAMLRESSGPLDGKRKQMASRLNADAAENGVRLPFRSFRQLRVGQRAEALGFRRTCNPHHAAAVARQRDEHARSLRRMKLGGDIPMRPGMGDIEGQRRLIEFAAPDLDAGCRATERLAPVGADHEATRAAICPAGCGRQHRPVPAQSCRPHRRSASGSKTRPRAVPAPTSARGFRCCSRTGRGRSHRKKIGPPARGSAGRYRRPGAWSAMQPPRRRSATRRRGGAGDRRNRRAARWCDCRHRASGARSGRCSRRFPPLRPRPPARPDHRRPRRHRICRIHRSFQDN